MRLLSGLVIRDPFKLLTAFVRIWYPMYDAVPVAQDNELHVPDIALSIMLNSRISGNTAGEIWQARDQINAGLAKIPRKANLLVPADSDIPHKDGISQAITAMCAIYRVKVSVSTKILHKKRPGLIPIFDSIVASQYWSQFPAVRDRSWGDYAVELTRWVRRDMLAVASELEDLRVKMDENGTPLTACRILNVLTWMARSKKADWFVKEAGTRLT